MEPQWGRASLWRKIGEEHAWEAIDELNLEQENVTSYPWKELVLPAKGSFRWSQGLHFMKPKKRLIDSVSSDLNFKCGCVWSDWKLGLSWALPLYSGSSAWFTCKDQILLSHKLDGGLSHGIASKCKTWFWSYNFGMDALGFSEFPSGLWGIWVWDSPEFVWYMVALM